MGVIWFRRVFLSPRRRARPPQVDEAGVALIEFAVSFPLLVLLVAGALEVGHGFVIRNQGELFAEELGTAIFHECKDKDLEHGKPYTAAEARTCVVREMARFHEAFRVKTPRSVALATIYRAGPEGLVRFVEPQRSCPKDTDEDAEFACGEIQSAYDRKRADEELRTLVSLSGWVVVVETVVASDRRVGRLLASLGLEHATYSSVSIL